jgi:Na+-translocating ferredoxin:NAD+ oxidoreductase RnfD subunit
VTTVALPAARPARTLRVRDRVYPVVPPNVRDPRLHVAAVLVSVQVLGQVSLGFELSIAQILLSIGTCGVLEAAITFWRRRAIVWPASALLTGNGVALILRVQGTQHGDWWSLRGGWIFASVAAVSLLSKYAVRIGGRQIFNPSNVGLVLAFVVLGTNRVNPQDLWWGPMSVGLAITYAVILGGGIAVVSRLRMVPLAATFWAAFAAGVGIVALTGHAISARWHVGPVSGWTFWWVLVTSPEVLIFLFFMITDPRTAPEGRVARVVYGAGVAFFAALFMASAPTEFWTKVAILGALTAVCAVRPALELLVPAPGGADDRVRAWLRRRSPTPAAPARTRWGALAGVVLVGAGLIVLAGLPAHTGRVPTLPRVDASQLAARPSVQLAPGAVPTPTVDPAVRAIVPSLDRAQVARRAHDLVADLVIAGDALTTRNPRLAATAGAGTWLLDLQQQIAAAGNDRPIAVPRYRFDSIRLVLVRRTGQSSPQVMLSVTGTVRTDTDASAGTAPTRGSPVPYRRAYLMVPVAGVWLVASAQPPP